MGPLALRTIPGMASLGFLLALWELASRTRAVNPVLLPPPSAVMVELMQIVASGAVAGPLLHTLWLLAVGYAIACLLGIVFGIGMGANRTIFRLFEPLIEFLRPIPKPALLPPLFLFLGFGYNTMVFVVALAAFFPVLINTIQAVQGVDRTLIDTAHTFRLNWRQRLWKVTLPACVPMILTGMRVSLGLALILVTVAEVLAGENGIGYEIMDRQQTYRIQSMYAWLIILAALGFGLNFLFERIEARLTRWHGQ